MTIGLNIKGHTVILDEEDYDLISQYTWRYHVDGYLIAHQRDETKPKKYRTITMHRLIMGATHLSYPLIDHRNQNKRDNRKSNLRFATYNQNARNLKARGRSKFLGVSYRKMWNGKYEYVTASILANGKHRNLGQFKTEEEAALAYNEAASRYFGEFANLNVL